MKHAALGIKLHHTDAYKQAIEFGHQLALKVIAGSIEINLAKSTLLESYPVSKYPQCLEIFEFVLSKKRMPYILLIKRPKSDFFKSFWVEYKSIALLGIIGVSALFLRFLNDRLF